MPASPENDFPPEKWARHSCLAHLGSFFNRLLKAFVSDHSPAARRVLELFDPVLQPIDQLAKQ
jgi:hypothetical protein